jgi:hypothetical protein
VAAAGCPPSVFKGKSASAAKLAVPELPDIVDDHSRPAPLSAIGAATDLSC